MRAIAVTAFGGPETLELIEAPMPVAGVGQVIIAVHAAGVGLADTLLRKGFLPHVAPGFTPGLEVAGIVASVGDDVDPSWIDSRAYAMIKEGAARGGYAEFVAVDVHDLVHLPPTISAEQAVSLGINALVAEFVVRRAQVRSGDQLLVRGASGGIGAMAVQIARLHGAVVTASTSSARWAPRLRQLGASYVVDRKGVGYDDETLHAYDVVIDPVAGPDLLTFTNKLNDNGRLVLTGIAGGLPPVEFANALISPRSLIFSLLSLDTVAMPERQSALREIFAEASRGGLTPVIHQTIGLEQAREGHATLEGGNFFGKIVLDPRPSGNG